MYISLVNLNFDYFVYDFFIKLFKNLILSKINYFKKKKRKK